MKVMFLKNVGGVGQRDTVKEVQDGYALNYLIPQGLAIQADKTAVAALRLRLEKRRQETDVQNAELVKAAKRLEGSFVEIPAKANERNHLYGQLTHSVVADAVKRFCGIPVPESAIHLHTPIKEAGDFAAEFSAGDSPHVAFTIRVVPI